MRIRFGPLILRVETIDGVMAKLIAVIHIRIHKGETLSTAVDDLPMRADRVGDRFGGSG